MRRPSTKALALASAAVLGVSALGASQAQAGFSSIQPSHKSGELNLPDVLGQAFGGTFQVASNGMDYTNGTVTATRVDDSADQVWNKSIVSARAVYDPDASSGALKFGYLPGTTGGTFTPLFTESGSMANVSGSSAAANPGASYRLAIQRGSGQTVSSANADNPDGLDRLVTYKVSGTGASGQTYLLGFEDSAHPPFDYNDAFVVQTPGVTPAASGNAVPVPLAAWTGLSGLAGLAVARIARRRRTF